MRKRPRVAGCVSVNERLAGILFLALANVLLTLRPRPGLYQVHSLEVPPRVEAVADKDETARDVSALHLEEDGVRGLQTPPAVRLHLLGTVLLYHADPASDNAIHGVEDHC